jgi:hypothetical protein
VTEPHPTLGAIIKFANATDRARSTVFANLRDQSESEYDPATDFWKRMRDAVKRDRKSSRDGSSVYEAARDATPRKRASFERAASGWNRVIPRWAESEYLAPIAADVDVFGLTVHVTPAFLERHASGVSDVVAMYYNAEPLTQSTIDEVLRVVSLAYAGDSFRPTLVDLRRAAVHQRILGDVELIDDRLATMAEYFQRRWAA